MGEVLYSDIHGYKQKLEGDQLEGDQLERGRCCSSIPLLVCSKGALACDDMVNSNVLYAKI